MLELQGKALALRKDFKKMVKKQTGFTLIEMIAVFLIMGVMATVAGMAIVTGMKGYLFAKDNLSISQKSQMAMARMNRELMELLDVSTAESSRITYQRLDGTGTVTQTIYLDETDEKVKIASGLNPSDGDTLVDHVGEFKLTYYKGTGFWVAGTDDIQELSAIGINLDLKRFEDERIIEFSTMVSPRNNKNYGGAP